MTLRELRYLVALADCGHFGRAAVACHVSQPTLSTQVKKLEAFLGVTLFERTNKTLHVTPVGAEIVARARRVLAEADALIDIARHTGGPLAGPLNLGIIPTLSPYALPWLLPATRAAYPNLQLVIHENLTDNLVAGLKDHKIDAALLALPIDEPELAARPLFDEPFFFACSSTHPLAATDQVSQRDLRHADLLLLTDGHCLRDQALAICGIDAPAAGLNADFHATSLETIRQMITAGMGSTLLPAMAVQRSDPSGSLQMRPIAGDASRRIGMVWRRTYPQAADLELLAKVITENMPACVEPIRS